MPTARTPGADGASNTVGVLAATGSLLATLLTGAACVGPLVAILLGVGGFGWLTQYAYLRVPASLATLALLAVGFWWAYGPRSRRCGERARRRRRVTRALLWVAVLLAVATNLFEYVVLPQMG